MTSVDKEKCIGCGRCIEICEEVFSMQSDGKAFVKKESNNPCVKDAIASCPVEAIEE
ncbi:ferredoxin [Candidatus Pacearchaeota archaeon]|nr:ferredoxin [Candidatus Pacearchaeota archaeon]